MFQHGDGEDVFVKEVMAVGKSGQCWPLCLLFYGFWQLQKGLMIQKNLLWIHGCEFIAPSCMFCWFFLLVLSFLSWLELYPPLFSLLSQVLLTLDPQVWLFNAPLLQYCSGGSLPFFLHSIVRCCSLPEQAVEREQKANLKTPRI